MLEVFYIGIMISVRNIPVMIIHCHYTGHYTGQGNYLNLVEHYSTNKIIDILINTIILSLALYQFVKRIENKSNSNTNSNSNSNSHSRSSSVSNNLSSNSNSNVGISTTKRYTS